MRALSVNNYGSQFATVNLLSGLVDVEKQFETAIEAANTGYKLRAMELAREALMHAKQKNDYTAVYIHSFLAAISIDFKQYNNARIHIYNAVNRLEKGHYSYQSDREYFDALQKALEKAEQSSQLEGMKELAA
jgi:hypothetical protein